MKAIETKYKGYRFRSRLEARWAVCFNSLKLKWDYEPEGFDFENGIYYLPDFKVYIASDILKDVYAWIEIKATLPTAEEIEKCMLLKKGQKYPVYFFVGTPGEHEIYQVYWSKEEYIFKQIKGDINSITARVFALEPDAFKIITGMDVVFAIEDARAARFEHGENVNE